MKGKVMTLLTLLLIGTACNDQTDNPTINPSVGEMVEVSLNIGFAHETDASTLLAANTTKSTTSPSGNEPLSVQLVPATRSAEATTAHPDQFYNLEIYQYDANGSYLANTTAVTVAEGPITATLNNSTAQLLIIARGSTPAISSFANKSLSDVRKLTATADIIKAIGVEDGTDINNMPYLLYLPEVKIESNTLVSPEGVDVRLLLKRLAVGLKLDWTISQNMLNQGYVLKEARLMQVPADYRILPERETEALYGEMYPTSVSEFVDGFRLKGDALTNANGSTTLWLPANARGTRRDINVPNQKSKRRAHSSATYIEFVVDNSKNQERLFYRVYLGANMTTDFNLLENTNYHWTIKIETPNYTTDERVQLLDQTPVISANEQPTANCFMMRPGTNICFNPYKHEAGMNGWNTYLTDGNGNINSDKEITKVEVLWQTKDAGTSGDLVLGYVIDDTNHKNLVNLTGTGMNDTRIHIKVPNTNGGNAVIAAYNNNTIVWSWHIWISDYVPATLTGDITTPASRLTAIDAAQKATRNGMVHVYGGISWTEQNGSFYKCVIMDRNLGATKGGLQNNAVDWVRTFGMLYQGGRKDPIFGTPDGSTNEARTIYDGNGNALELDKTSVDKTPTLDQTIQNPLKFYGAPVNNWNGDAAKTIYDPCPKGWRVPSNEYLNNGTSTGISLSSGWSGFVYNQADSKASLCAGFGRTESDYVCEWSLTEKTSNNIMYYDGSKFNTLIGQGFGGNVSKAPTDAFKGTNGAGYLYFGGSGENKDNWTNKSAFFPTAVLREGGHGGFRPNSNNKLFLWSSSTNRNGKMQMYEFQSGLLSFQHTNPSDYGFSVRCIQDNIKDRSFSDYQSEK